MRRIAGGLLLALAMAVRAFAQAPPDVIYHVTFPAPEHHWVQVEATFRALPSGPFIARMSRSSPGRYSIHEFAKNVFSLTAYDGAGHTLAVTRPDADSWRVAAHDGTVRVVYEVFGDRVDGTYLGIDTTHAHINVPAAFIWGVGLDLRPVRVMFTLPAASHWKIATQLFETADPLTFTAPNLQYFIDSPMELSSFLTSDFTLPDASGAAGRFRLAADACGTQADVDAFVRTLARLVAEETAVFGERPSYEPGRYTFILDCVAWGDYDGMEHRNSTFITLPGISLATPEGRRGALDAVAHEFFHNWNVERIRPAGIEPFDLTRENVTCCLWLAEGFTQYYGELLLHRAGLAAQVPIEFVSPVVTGSGRRVRSAVEMSEEAPFADMGVSNDIDDRSRTFISYYTYGGAIALGLDFAIRERSGGRLSLDDYMRRLWADFGKPPDPRPGYVARPYTLADLRAELTALTGDRAFADTIFDKDIEGRDVMDYARLLSLAGYVVRPFAPTRGWLGDVPVLEMGDGLAVGLTAQGAAPAPLPFGTPLYDAGLDEGDTITSIAGEPATMRAWQALAQRKPGDRVSLVVRRRGGTTVTLDVTLAADPRLQVLPVESAGGTLTPQQRAFRDAWLGAKAR